MAGLNVCLQLVHEALDVFFILTPTGTFVYSHGKGLRLLC